MMRKWLFLPLILFSCLVGQVRLGVDILVGEQAALWQGKRLGLIVNHTSVNANLVPTHQWMQRHGANIVALFAPEHGFKGNSYADEQLSDSRLAEGLPIYSLHGKTRRPTKQMLKDVDLLIFDIQDIGTRTYTYISTLFYAMEEAAKHNIPFIVCDRPNPMGGIVDGPLLELPYRSFLGYVSVPTCHGMTAGELARFFNQAYNIGCKLTVVPMQGWKRWMTYRETQLPWIPTSPQIPECDTPLYYPITGPLGELKLVNVGVGYTLPFKIIGAPWIEAEKLATALNKVSPPGITFHPFHFRPFFGLYKNQECAGVHLVIFDPSKLRPIATQYLLLGVLKSLYPEKFAAAWKGLEHKKEALCKIHGTEKVWQIVEKEKYIAYPLAQLCEEGRALFAPVRKQYLFAEYEAN